MGMGPSATPSRYKSRSGTPGLGATGSTPGGKGGYSQPGGKGGQRPNDQWATHEGSPGGLWSQPGGVYDQISQGGFMPGWGDQSAALGAMQQQLGAGAFSDPRYQQLLQQRDAYGRGLQRPPGYGFDTTLGPMYQNEPGLSSSPGFKTPSQLGGPGRMPAPPGYGFNDSGQMMNKDRNRPGGPGGQQPGGPGPQVATPMPQPVARSPNGITMDERNMPSFDPRTSGALYSTRSLNDRMNSVGAGSFMGQDGRNYNVAVNSDSPWAGHDMSAAVDWAQRQQMARRTGDYTGYNTGLEEYQQRWGG